MARTPEDQVKSLMTLLCHIHDNLRGDLDSLSREQLVYKLETVRSLADVRGEGD